jgi:hypothetical protein
VSNQRRHGTTGNPRPNAVGTARQDHWDACAENQARAVGASEKAQLLGENIAGFEIGREEDISIAGHIRADPFDLSRLRADGVVECQRAVDKSASDLAALRHFAERSGIDRGRHFRRDCFDGSQNSELGLRYTQRNREVDGVLSNVDFIF